MAFVAAAPASAASCNTLIGGNYNKIGGQAIDWANVRSGPTTQCSVVDRIYTEFVYYVCWTSGEGGSWSLIESRDGSGWVKDSLLVNNGAWDHC
jgi:hypothetical protein